MCNIEVPQSFPVAFWSHSSWDFLKNQPMDLLVRSPQFALTPHCLFVQRELHDSDTLASVSLKWNPDPRGAASFLSPAQLPCTHWRPTSGSGVMLHCQHDTGLLQWTFAAAVWPSPFSTDVELQHLNNLILINCKEIAQSLLQEQLSKRLAYFIEQGMEVLVPTALARVRQTPVHLHKEEYLRVTDFCYQWDTHFEFSLLKMPYPTGIARFSVYCRYPLQTLQLESRKESVYEAPRTHTKPGLWEMSSTFGNMHAILAWW